MKVVAISGSPRLKGHTNYLIDQALAELEAKGIETEKIVLNEYKFSPCQAHANCREAKECLQKDDGNWILDKYSQADGVILASPVYFGSYTAQMKIFIDRSFFLFMHGKGTKAKCAGIIAIAGRGGHEQTAQALSRYVSRNPDLKVFTLIGASGPPDSDPKAQTELVEKAKAMGRDMTEILTAAPPEEKPEQP